jgi:diguanylate cyclase (GGDEF)-like protein
MEALTNLRILIIDDNPQIHNDFIKILTYENDNKISRFDYTLFNEQPSPEQRFLPNFEIDTALQGEEGIKLVRKAIDQNMPFAIAFVDIRMPGMDGIKAIKEIWSIDPDIQVVICTAYSDYTWEETVAELGEKENLLVLKKPFDIVAVRQLSLALSKKWQLMQESRAYEHSLEKKIKERTLSLQNALEKQEYLATHDILTSLPNRVLLADRLRQLIAYSKRDKSLFAILFFDIDRFKLVNDSLGHSLGDELLKVVAKRLLSSVRENDTVARIGGDEFVVILNQLRDVQDINAITQNIMEILRQPIVIGEHKLLVTTSVGISIYPKDGDTIDDLLRNADIAMYKAKGLGCNQFQFYSEKLNKEGLERLEWETALHLAIRNQEFFLHYQPLFDIETNKILSVEALIRWNHPQKGIIFPMDFIPLAEQNGLIIPIGEWALKEACSQNKKWQEMGLTKVRVAVNMASQQLKQPNIVERIKCILKETGLDPSYLELELTENTIINSIESSDALGEFKKLGINIALDDFGTGYSNLHYLRKIPLDRLKVGQAFVESIGLNRGDEIITKAIIAMARSLNLDVVVEGVETKSQINFLKTINCDKVQGFYFSKPLPARDVESILRNPPQRKE